MDDRKMCMMKSRIACLLLTASLVMLPFSSALANPTSVTEQQINNAIDRGLQYLHKTAQQTDADTAYWDTAYPVATTASAVLAFEVSGHVPSRSRIIDPYVDTVQRGLNYVLTALRKQAIGPQPAGDPDSNGNGYGLYVATTEPNVVIYTTGIALMAIAASNVPDTIANIGDDGVRGRKYREIAQDIVDYLAWAQADPPSPARGGWRYRPNDGEADMSVTQWPVLGMEAAATNMKATIPGWVKNELRDGFLAYAQGSDGGFGYTAPDGGNIARTGAGLVGLAFTGVPADDDRVRRAMNFVASNWNSDNLGNFYAMYGLMKGSRLTQPEIKQYGSHDWYAEYAEYLVTHQEADGSWKESFYSRGNIPLATAWAILILSRTVFTPIRLNLPLWIFLPLLLIPLIGVAFWILRRASLPPKQRVVRPVITGTRGSQSWGTEQEQSRPSGKDITHGRPRGDKK